MSKYFKPQEFACKCCGQVKTNSILLNLLDSIREQLNEPVYINSGYRCEKHNAEVDGKKQSQHLLGNAADIHVKSLTPKQLYNFLEKEYDIPGMGLYNTFVHIDVRTTGKARW
jgi:uncharacterized protein YcbK (DUF882 family)